MMHFLEQSGSWFGRLCQLSLTPTPQMCPNRPRNGGPQTVLPETVDGVVVGAGIGSGRSRSNGAEIITDHIREDEREDGGMSGCRQPTAFQIRQVLTDAVDVPDAG